MKIAFKSLLTFVSKDDLSKGALKSISVRVFSLLMGFLLQLVLARSLSDIDFGNYVYVITLIGFLTLFGVIGLDTASRRFIPEFLVNGEAKKLIKYFYFSFIIAFTTSFLISFSGFTLIKSGILVLDEGLSESLKTGFILFPIVVMLYLLVAQIEAKKWILSAQIPFHIARPFLIICTVFTAIYLLNTDINAVGMLWINISVSLLIAVVLFGFLMKAYRLKLQNGVKIFDQTSSAWLKVALPLFMTTGLHLILAQADVLLIGYFLGTTNAGYYAVALKLASLVLLGLTAVNVVAAPIISEYFTAGKIRELQKVITQIIIIVTLISITLGTLMIILDKFILSLYGVNFIRSQNALTILVVANILNTFTGSISVLLAMTHNHIQLLKILIFAATMNIVMNIILIPIYSIEGAAIATLISTLIWNSLMYFTVKKQLRLDSSPLSIRYLFKN